MEGWRLQLAKAQRDERSPVFASPIWELDSEAPRSIANILADIDKIVDETIGLDSAELRRLSIGGESGAETDSEDDGVDEDDNSSISDDAAMLSWSLGVAIGRFDIRVATGARHVTAQSDPFDCIPSLSPGMLPTDSPVFTASTGILVDDVGHTSDIVASVTAVFESIGVTAPDPQLLRRYFAREFFPVHLKAYSKNRRKAPIYWQIGTPSGGYSIWIYTCNQQRHAVPTSNGLGHPKIGSRKAAVGSNAT
jgi:hypothetical protein